MADVSVESSEDTIIYCLFTPLPEDFDAEKKRRHVEQKLESYLAEISSTLVDYIWNNEPFNLRVADVGCSNHAHQNASPLHIMGRTTVGDNIEDEWFIVYLLLQLTVKFTDLIISVSDTDGQFLMIEAADYIPKWLQPETADNRIFLSGGKLHLVPLPQNSEQASVFPLWTPSVEEALKCIRQYSDQTVASQDIQSVIHNRIKGYPEKSRQLMHRSHCYVPAAISVLLKESPNILGAAVRAFSQRDPVDLQSCRTFTHFRPGTRIMTLVKFNRCQYAQLMQQRFTPDRRCGYILPASSHKDYKKHELGMKLAHGFEILCSRCTANRSGDGAASYRVNTGDHRWTRYVRALREKGYFRGEMEGSKLYRDLLNQARLYYQSMINSMNETGSDPGRVALDILDRVDINIDQLRQNERYIDHEDDDTWLTIDDKQLEELFRARGGIQTSDLDDKRVAQNMKAFVGQVSSHEGAELPDHDEDGDVQFENEGFIHSMHKMFEFEDDHDGSSSGMSEYSDDDEATPDPHFDASAPRSRVKKSPDGLGDMTDYMELMDRELAKTTLGDSFVKTSGPSGSKNSSTGPGSTNNSSTGPGSTNNSSTGPSSTKNSSTGPSGQKGPVAPPRRNKPTNKRVSDRFSTTSVDSIDDLDDEFSPVNVDMNLVKNMLHSYQSQQGQPGPATNIMGAMAAKDKRK